MSDMDWSTPEGLAAIRAHLAERLDGWTPPVAWAVGITPASSDPDVQFPHVNLPGGSHGLAAVVLASVLRHDGATATLDVSVDQLQAAFEGLEPARACTTVEHPNLGAWRGLLTEARDNPARELVAVFVADLDDPVSSDADGEMRAGFEGLHPRA
ncbi:hypothetical protein ASJ30_01805 [Janibacter indicus]|uniref:Uncharacterized protein n=1 Tax=Janibacter indicus TaxID=857417 RepID=A0A1L3MDI3_9MICO|nr:hypothetical protein [Janibacter indicus]APH00418.1 hypothetical protein ASJ30_01805 [Janibacter indicus]